MSKMFKSKKPSVEEVAPPYPEAKDITKQLLGQLGGWAGRLGEAYGGKLVSEMSPEEQLGYQMFQKWTGAPAYTESPLYGASRAELQRILGGEYLKEPTEAYRQLRRTVLEEELPEAQAQLRRALAMRGTFYSGAAAQGEQDVVKDAMNRLAQYRANELLRERERMAAAVPMGMQLARTEAYEPLERVQAIMAAGAFPRELEQAQLQAAYNEWLRQRGEAYQFMPTALQMGTTPGIGLPTYTYTPGQASPFARFAQPIATLGGGALGFMLGGPAGAALGAGLGGTLGGAAGTLAGGEPSQLGAGLQLMNYLSPYFPRMGGITGGQGGTFTGWQTLPGMPTSSFPTWSPY
jgi:hypothetical protein